MAVFQASKKVAGGKLVRVKIEVDDDFIRNVSITGDFFMHPEERISFLEGSLVGMAISDISSDVVYDRFLADVQEAGDITLYGVSLKDMADTAVDALRSSIA